MSAFDEATLKKNFGGKPSSKLTLKKNGTTVVATVILEVMDWRCVLQIFWNNSILKKSWTLNPNQFLSQEMYVTITILECLHGICLTDIPEEKYLKLSDHLIQI